MVAEQCQREGDAEAARRYRDAAYRLWRKITPLEHATAERIETYGGQPNKQAADILTAFDPGRMIWNGYTGAAGWLFRQTLEGLAGARLEGGRIVLPPDFHAPLGDLTVFSIFRNLQGSPMCSRAGSTGGGEGGPRSPHPRVAPAASTKGG